MVNVEENMRCINFLIQKMEDTYNPLLNMREVWREYRTVTSSKKSVQFLEHRFVKCVAPKISGMELDYETKLKIFFATHTPVDAAFREEMNYFAESVQVDHRGIITCYRGRDGLVLSVNTRPTTRRLHWTEVEEVENLRMLQFLAQMVKQQEGPLDMFLVWCQYKTHSQTRKEVDQIRDHFRDKLAPIVHRDRHFDIETRIRMLIGAQIPVTRQFFRAVERYPYADHLIIK